VAIRLAMQVVLRPPEVDRRIFPYQEEIPRFSRDSASHWIAAVSLPCLSRRSFNEGGSEAEGLAMTYRRFSDFLRDHQHSSKLRTCITIPLAVKKRVGESDPCPCFSGIGAWRPRGLRANRSVHHAEPNKTHISRGYGIKSQDFQSPFALTEQGGRLIINSPVFLQGL